MFPLVINYKNIHITDQFLSNYYCLIQTSFSPNLLFRLISDTLPVWLAWTSSMSSLLVCFCMYCPYELILLRWLLLILENIIMFSVSFPAAVSNNVALEIQTCWTFVSQSNGWGSKIASMLHLNKCLHLVFAVYLQTLLLKILFRVNICKLLWVTVFLK